MAIIVRGATCSLGEAVVDKLLSMDIDVVAIEESHRIRNETLLKYSEAKLLSEGEGYSISFDGSVADLVIGENLIVHDPYGDLDLYSGVYTSDCGSFRKYSKKHLSPRWMVEKGYSSGWYIKARQ